MPEVDALEHFESAPITAVHLWFDRPITPLPHAVLVDRLSQWLFNRGERPRPDDQGAVAHCCQVVISASRQLAGRPREEVRDEVLADLQAVWPAAKQANLLHWRMVTQADAVFSLTPQIENTPPGPAIIARQPILGRRLDRYRLARHNGKRRTQRLSGG